MFNNTSVAPGGRRNITCFLSAANELRLLFPFLLFLVYPVGVAPIEQAHNELRLL